MTFLPNLKNRFFRTRWNIGFIEESIENYIHGDLTPHIHWLQHTYKDRWFADPFILSVDNQYIRVLVEEFYYPIGRGRIAQLKIRKKDYYLVENKTLIEESTHLSFPFIIRTDNTVFIMPENGASGQLKWYRYNTDTEDCIYEKTITHGNYADAVLLQDTHTIAATTLPNPNGNELNFYSLQHGDAIQSHKVTFEKAIARNAGDWFTIKGKTYRPAQDCSKRYGEAMVIQEVENLEHLKFKDIRRIEPTSKRYNLGIHTLNSYGDLIVVDGFGYANWITRLYYRIQNNR